MVWVDYTLLHHIEPSSHPLWLSLLLLLRPVYHPTAYCLAISEAFEAQFDERLADSTVVVHVAVTAVEATRNYWDLGVAGASEGGSQRAPFVASHVPTLSARGTHLG